MNSFILIGGGDYRKDETSELDNKLLKFISETDPFVVVPFATSEEKYGSWYETIKRVYGKIGIVDFHLAKTKSDLTSLGTLFLTGGNPDKLMPLISKSDLLSRNVIGYSAGAMIFGSGYVLVESNEIKEGLGIIDAAISVHYNSEDDKTLKVLSLKKTIVAIPNNSAIVITDDKIQVIGEIIVFKNSKKKQFLDGFEFSKVEELGL